MAVAATKESDCLTPPSKKINAGYFPVTFYEGLKWQKFPCKMYFQKGAAGSVLSDRDMIKEPKQGEVKVLISRAQMPNVGRDRS